MTAAPHIHGKWRSFSVSDALEVLGEDLCTIRKEDRLTWKEVGRIIGKSDDRASDYASAISEMPVGAFLLGLREWNGRLGGRVMAMIGQKLGPVDTAEMSDPERLTHILALAHVISAALVDEKTPGSIDDDELDGISTEILDNATRGIEALRDRKSRRSANVSRLRA